MSTSLENVIAPERVAVLQSTTKDDALKELIGVLAGAPEVTDAGLLHEAIVERERIMSTGIGLGIAIPHAKIPSVRDFVVAFGKTTEPLDFNSLDGKPVRFIVMIAGPDDQQERYLQLLARITLKLKDESIRRRLGDAENTAAILGVLS